MPEFQHYINKRHLELFLPDDSKNRRLHVYSKRDGYVGTKSYNRIAGDFDTHPRSVEERMGVVESEALKTLRGLSRGVKWNFDSSEHKGKWDSLLTYMALTVARHPERIEEWRQNVRRELSVHPRLLTDWREMTSAEAFYNRLFGEGVPLLVEPLRRLQWVTLRPADPAHSFAVSDRCVDIAWGGPFGPPNRRSLVVMPVSRNIVLIGGRNDEEVKQWFRLVGVSNLNAMMLQRSGEFMFSTDRLDYDALHKAGRISRYGETIAEQREGAEGAVVEIWRPPAQGN
jgi:hypothetical protein